MPKAIHLICRRDDGVNLNGLEALGGGRWRSQYWTFLTDDAQALVGGWIYLHGMKSRPSEFGGHIQAVEPVKRPGYAREDGYAVVFVARREGRNQAWRGASYGMAWTGGPVDLSHPHEERTR